jgi:hypothetical protein
MYQEYIWSNFIASYILSDVLFRSITISQWQSMIVLMTSLRTAKKYNFDQFQENDLNEKWKYTQTNQNSNNNSVQLEFKKKTLQTHVGCFVVVVLMVQWYRDTG